MKRRRSGATAIAVMAAAASVLPAAPIAGAPAAPAPGNPVVIAPPAGVPFDQATVTAQAALPVEVRQVKARKRRSRFAGHWTASSAMRALRKGRGFSGWKADL